MAAPAEQHSQKANWLKRVNPLRVGLTIIVGILTIYVAILWDRNARMEQEVTQLKAQNAEMKIQLDGIRTQLKSMDKRLPMGQFRLRTFPDQNTGHK